MALSIKTKVQNKNVEKPYAFFKEAELKLKQFPSALLRVNAYSQVFKTSGLNHEKAK